MDPKKAAAEWFISTVFKEEPIKPRPEAAEERVPGAIRAARALTRGTFQSWLSREDVFLKQAKLLENYTDSYEWDCDGLTVYYPTYQSLNDRQLRAYFTWRARTRQGEAREAPLCFAFLYIYELLNQIGVKDPMEGYERLTEFRDGYGQINKQILSYLARWLTDYVVYYDLDPALLSGSEQVIRDRCITVLEQIQEREDSEIMEAVRQLSRWPGRSKFCADHQAEMDRVTVRVLRSVSAHCARYKSTMADRYFGANSPTYGMLFSGAVFCDPLKRRNYRYILNEQCVYLCKNGMWTVCRRMPDDRCRGKLDNLLKSVDTALREALDYGRPIKVKPEPKWILTIIQKEVQALMAEKRALETERAAAEARKVTIDFGQLSRIRRDAGLTREKLIVEEELDSEPPAGLEAAVRPEGPEVNTELSPETAEDLPLDQPERRLLRCLLRGEDTGWVQQSGYLLSVLADGINEKLYDIFADNVLDETPQVIEDYIDDLKEMVCP